MKISKQCPFCNEKFKLLGGGKDQRYDEKNWIKTLFSHLYWMHESEFDINEEQS